MEIAGNAPDISSAYTPSLEIAGNAPDISSAYTPSLEISKAKDLSNYLVSYKSSNGEIVIGALDNFA